MKKIYTRMSFLAWMALAALTVLPQPAAAQQDTRRPRNGAASQKATARKAPQKADAATTDKTAYGMLFYDETDYSYTNGLVSFPLSGTDTYGHIRLFGDATHDVTAAAFAEGYYYLAKTVQDGQTLVPCELLRYDFDTDEVKSVGAMSGFTAHLNDMTFDYSTGTMYAITNQSGTVAELYTIDLETAASTKVASLDRCFFTLAATYEGQLYAISYYGDLCKIDKQTGSVTEVGATTWYPTYIQSMEFDHTTETLYWAADLQSGPYSDCIATVDTVSGQATYVSTVGDNTELLGLYVPFSASVKEAPAAVEGLTVVPDAEGKNQAVLTWTSPTTTFGGQELTDMKEVRIYRNKTLVGTVATASPGYQSSFTDKTPDGMGQFYTYKVVAVNGVGEGAATEQRVFVGHDLPKAVTDIQLSATDFTTAALSWQLPEAGQNGGYVDKASLSYTVTRQPDGKTVATGLKKPTLTDTDFTSTRQYSYTIKAVNADGESPVASSASKTFGPAYSMPFSFDFTDGQSDDSWTIVDANGDGYAWTWTQTADGNTVMGHQASNTVQSDDWLISYYIPFQKGTVYRVDYDLHAYSRDAISFHLLDGTDYSDPVQDLTSPDIQGARETKHYNFTFTSEAEGYRCLALHAQSPLRADWLQLYNISIREAEAYNLAATALTGDEKPRVGKESTYSLTVENQGTKKVYGFKAFLKDQSGNELVQKSVAKTLDTGESTTVELAWTPADTGVTGLVGQVQLFGATDECADDDTTDTRAVQVQEAVEGDLVEIGTGSTSMGSTTPFNFPYQWSASLNIYAASEMTSSQSLITKVAWPYDAAYVYSDVEDANVKVYMANTDRTTTTDGWLAQEDMTLVYEGLAAIEKKTTGDLVLTLSTPFAYEQGKNLAVLTTLSCSNYYSYLTFKNYTSPLAGNASLDWHAYYKATDFDFTQKGSQNGYGRSASVTFYMSDKATGIDRISDLTGASYKVFDLSGRQVATGTASASGTIDTRQLTGGIYVVQFQKDGKAQSMKVSVRK